MKKGQIRKALSGFYYVYSEGEIFQTRGRGLFRKTNESPLVGDFVDFESTNIKEGVIQAIDPRKNQLERPPIANVDLAVIVVSAKEPAFSHRLLDRYLIVLESKHIQSIIYFTKLDICNEKELATILQAKALYEEIGYQVFMQSSLEEYNISNEFSELFKNNVTVFMGQTGVGKSTLLNRMLPDLKLKTGEVSSALGRGKHTTRHVELVEMYGGLIADTPGFSSLNLDDIEKYHLPFLFPEFVKYADQCKFSGCMHKNEPKCEVKRQVDVGGVSKQRYENYLMFLEEIENRKPHY
ncbi:ribosome small subunit-dependent GTPase A [Lacticigenium naphthae]|uniref:ribosome small subunit-dependent GTPase A n=1 Tax=Lacticigenium naphthae TaxID=515351 RepID=UPI0004161CCF|nr:ribosome small subunit-dependent GTPase A [Lacticigenium naphthae]